MLFSIESNSEITTIPHRRDYDRWRSRLTEEEYGAVFDEINHLIEGTEVQTTSWMPGSDWRGTVYQKIYEIACEEDEVASALFFGLIVWDAFMRHPDWWSMGRYEKDGVPIQGLTYFRIDPPH